MPTLTYSFKSKKNSNLIISPSQLKDLYFMGIPIRDTGGNKMSDDTIRTYIKSAQDEIERLLSLKLARTYVKETIDYSYDKFIQWGQMKVEYPVEEGLQLEGFLGDSKQVTYPKEWLTVKKTSDEKLRSRIIRLVPTAGSVSYQNSLYFGITSRAGYNSRNVPFYWHVEYISGFYDIPSDIVNAIGRLAAINIFHIMGDLILGAGIASQSISLDGLSQSISTTSSATNAGYGARITGYVSDLKRQIPALEDYYKGMTMSIM